VTKLGFGDYLKAAFNARPLGMFVPPNWVGIGAFGLLGLLNPGFWVLGAGLELGYLALLATNTRFQRTVAASQISTQQQDSVGVVNGLLARLPDEDKRRYRSLEDRCRAILDQQAQSALSVGLEAQGASLSRLAFVYLRLLVTKQGLQRILSESGRSDDLESRLRGLKQQLADTSIGDALRKSLTGQVEILEQRLQSRRDAREKMAFVQAELDRIGDQVELIREQAALSTDPESLSHRIDAITETIGGTGEWVREQQRALGAMEDLMVEPPPLTARASASERQ
jgi:hypothetical protein